MTAIEETKTTPPIYQELAKLLGHPDTYGKVAHEEYLREHGAGKPLDQVHTPEEMPTRPKPKPPARRKGVRNPKTP